MKSLFSTSDAKSFFSEVGGGRSSRLSSVLYIVLHDSEQIEVGGVTGSLEPSCNTFFQFWGIEERIKGVKKVRDLFYFCLIPMTKEYHFLIYS